MQGGSLSLRVTTLFGIEFEKKYHESSVKNIDLFMNIFFKK